MTKRHRPAHVIHDLTARKMIQCLKTPLAAGATIPQILVIGESVLVGIALVCVKMGGDNIVLDAMFERAKARLAEARLKDIEPGGSA